MERSSSRLLSYGPIPLLISRHYLFRHISLALQTPHTIFQESDKQPPSRLDSMHRDFREVPQSSIVRAPQKNATTQEKV
jgi:hypothetical protein